MRGFEPRDLLRFEFVGDPQISPDGRRVAWVQTTVDAQRNTYRSRIFLWQAGRKPVPFTAGPQDRTPRWSPDGRYLAFIRTEDAGEGEGARGQGRTQIWVMPTDGGEARPVTFVKDAPRSIAWSPDGRLIAFVARVKPSGIQRADARDEENPTGTPDDLDALDRKFNRDVRHITRIWYRQDNLGYLEDRRAHVFVVDVEAALAADPKDLPLPHQVTGGDFDHGAPAWSPDGRFIACSAVREPDADLATFSDIWVFAVDGSQPPRKLTRSRGPASQPSWSPDGRYIAYMGHERPVENYSNTRLWLVPADGSAEPRNLTAEFDRSFGNDAAADMRVAGGDGRPVWSPDGSALYCTASSDGTTHLFRIDTTSGQVTQVTRGDWVVFDWSYHGETARAALAVATPENPNDIYLAHLTEPDAEHGVRVERLTMTNRDLLSRRWVSIPEKFRFRAEGGPEVDGWIVKPANFDPGKRYPAVLQIHGGPMAMYPCTFFFEFQLLASAGIAVIYTNPRGSQGYGEDFCAGIRGNWGENDYADLMAGVDAALARYPWIDPERLGVAGGSYGGYMTAWITGHTHRFKAACVMRAVTNCYSFFGTSDHGYRWDQVWGDGKPPWENPEAYLRQSPISYVGNVRTPTLVIHSEEDHRCLIEQGEQWYTALKKLGVEAEFIRYPGETHELSRSGKPWHRVHRLRSIVNWFVRHLQPAAAADGEAADGEAAAGDR